MLLKRTVSDKHEQVNCTRRIRKQISANEHPGELNSGNSYGLGWLKEEPAHEKTAKTF